MRKSFVFFLVVRCAAVAFAVSPEWKYTQAVRVERPGLTQVELPAESVSKARPDLADLRIHDPTDVETPFFIDQPLMQAERQVPLQKLQMRMENGKTVIAGEVPVELQSEGFDAIHLYTHTEDFLKALTIEGSSDFKTWSTLVRARPVFKQPNQMASTVVPFEKGKWRALRLTLDDSNTPPLRISEVRIFARAKSVSNLRRMETEIIESTPRGTQTEVRLSLPQGNALVDSIEIETPEATFRRPVTVVTKQFASGEFRDLVLGLGLVYRVSLDQATAQELVIPLSRRVEGRELILRFENGDSPSLPVTKVILRVIPPTVVFNATAPGSYRLSFGYEAAPPKTYDIASLQGQIKTAQVHIAAAGPVETNPGYRAPEVLPQVDEAAAEIDTAPWRFRKTVTLTGAGVQRVELDLEALSGGARRLAALRLVRNGKQLPYVLDAGGVSRSFTPVLEPQPSDKNKSRWSVTLPHENVPLHSLRFEISEPLFQRQVFLYQDVRDERGEPRREMVGSALWRRTQQGDQESFLLPVHRNVREKRLILEMDNGDNAPIHLTKVTADYSAPRLLFKASPGAGLFLYYGQDDVAAPLYDLNLIAPEIQAVVPLEAKLGAQETLKAQPWWEVPLPDGGLKYVFWIVMALVVVALLTVIAKLLPETKEHA